jgi:hypothetical protein
VNILPAGGQGRYAQRSDVNAKGAATMDYDDLPGDAPGGDSPESGPYSGDD